MGDGRCPALRDKVRTIGSMSSDNANIASCTLSIGVSFIYKYKAEFVNGTFFTRIRNLFANCKKSL